MKEPLHQPVVRKERLVNKLRELGFKFQRQAPMVDLYRNRNGFNRVSVPRRDNLSQDTVRSILRNAGLGPEDIASFIASAIS